MTFMWIGVAYIAFWILTVIASIGMIIWAIVNRVKEKREEKEKFKKYKDY